MRSIFNIKHLMIWLFCFLKHQLIHWISFIASIKRFFSLCSSILEPFIRLRILVIFVNLSIVSLVGNRHFSYSIGIFEHAEATGSLMSIKQVRWAFSKRVKLSNGVFLIPDFMIVSLRLFEIYNISSVKLMHPLNDSLISWSWKFTFMSFQPHFYMAKEFHRFRWKVQFVTLKSFMPLITIKCSISVSYRILFTFLINYFRKIHLKTNTNIQNDLMTVFKWRFHPPELFSLSKIVVENFGDSQPIISKLWFEIRKFENNIQMKYSMSVSALRKDKTYNYYYYRTILNVCHLVRQ